MADEVHVVVAEESGKLLTGHDGKMTLEQAQARCKKANADAERLDIKSRYRVDAMTPGALKAMVRV